MTMEEQKTLQNLQCDLCYTADAINAVSKLAWSGEADMDGIAALLQLMIPALNRHADVLEEVLREDCHEPEDDSHEPEDESDASGRHDVSETDT